MEGENGASAIKPEQEKGKESKGESLTEPPPEAPPQNSGGGWGGWGFSPFSVLSDLQKAAAVAAEEFSRNATVVAEQAKKIADLQVDEDSDSSKVEKEAEESQTEDEKDKLRKSALDKLEKASEDSVLGQRLLALDSSVENFASGAWSALGNALRGGTNLVQQLENSAVNLADSIQEGGLPATSRAPSSFMETGKAFTSKGIQVLEYVGKETMDLLISETGMEVEKNSKDNEEQLYEEATFDRCFYIYKGPEQLEELEALSNHYAMLFNRRKAKLPQEQRSIYEGQLKQIQQIFSLSTEMDGTGAESNKGKKSEAGTEGSEDEMKSLHESGIRKAADMAAGFTNALAGLAIKDVNQRTTGRLESIHSEGVHRLSELCCFAVSQLLMLGKSIKSEANKGQEDAADEDMANVVWPEDSLEKAKIIRIKAQPMAGYLETVSTSFITGISDVASAYQAANKGATAESPEALPPASILEKVNALSEHIRSDKTIAMSKIQDGLQYLSYVILATSMLAA